MAEGFVPTLGSENSLSPEVTKLNGAPLLPLNEDKADMMFSRISGVMSGVHNRPPRSGWLVPGSAAIIEVDDVPVWTSGLEGDGVKDGAGCGALG